MVEFTLTSWVFAISPVVAVLVMMVGLGWGGSRTGLGAFCVALFVAWMWFGANSLLVGVAVAKSLLLAADVLYIVWMALFFYHVTNEAGTVQLIGQKLPELTSNRGIQSLLIGWVFVSLLQGVGGFGVPVAVVAPLLVGLGYGAVEAVIMASLGHGWAVTFGSLGTSFVALTAVTNLDGSFFAHEAALILGIAGLVSGALVVYVGNGFSGLLRSLPFLIVVGSVMGFVQWWVAVQGMWSLGATSGAMGGAVVGILLVLSPFYKGFEYVGDSDDNGHSIILALSAYVVLLLFAFSINLIPVLNSGFDVLQVKVIFPEVSTSFLWVTPSESGRVISVFGHPGAILFYSGLFSYWIYYQAGYYEKDSFFKIWLNVRKSAVKSTVSIAGLVAMASLMTHSGMTDVIARGVSVAFSDTVYPFFVPFIGVLGAFMTGSNTNSNVVFGALQQQTAELMGLNIAVILAGQTAGASLGSVLAPAKVVVGCSTVGLSGEEGPVIRRMLVLGLIPVLLVSFLTVFLLFFQVY